jgi:hypothetical protein
MGSGKSRRGVPEGDKPGVYSVKRREKTMANPDYDELLNGLIPFAQQMLEEHGEYFPFAMGITIQGEGQLMQLAPEEEQPDSEEVIDQLNEMFQEAIAKKEVRATGICSNVVIQDPKTRKNSDAIRVSLAHRDSPPAEVVIPYSKGAGGEYEYGELMAMPGSSTLFKKGK